MGSFTGLLLLGKGRCNDNGIMPSHKIYFNENSRPALLLIEESYPCRKPSKSLKTWIPTIDHTIEDAILMIMLYVWKDPLVLEMASQFFDIHQDYIQLYDVLSSEERSKLRKLSAERSAEYSEYKFIMCIFSGFGFRKNQLNDLYTYKTEIEICPVIYSKLHGSWGSKASENGSIEQIIQLLND